MPSFSVCGSRGCAGVGDSALERCMNTLIRPELLALLSIACFAVTAVRMRGDE